MTDHITDFALAERAALALSAEAERRGNMRGCFHWGHIAADIAAAADPEAPCEASLASAEAAYNADHALSDMMARIAREDAMRARMITQVAA